MKSIHKTLNIGHRAFKDYPERTGGVVVLFESWLEYCREQSMSMDVIDANSHNYSSKAVAFFSIIWQIICKMKRCDTIFLHGTIRDYIVFAPFIVWLARCRHKRVVMRKFAGNFAEIYESSNMPVRMLLQYALTHADVTCWETKALVEYGKKFNVNSVWFPNVRRDTGVRRCPGPYQCRLVFLSRVEKEKGIFTLIEAMKKLGAGYSLDIYGPLNGIEKAVLNGMNYHYQGCVPAHEVPSVLSRYDLLVLPTTWDTEGYPGIIIEAYGVGLPVIATSVGAIPEIVEEGITGFLMPPSDCGALVLAVQRFEEDNYHRFSASALDAFEIFDYDKTNRRIADLL